MGSGESRSLSNGPISPHRYITNSESVEILGGNVWARLLKDDQSIDFKTFSAVIQSRFPIIPVELIKKLFFPFISPQSSSNGSNKHEKEISIPADTFASTLAVLGCDRIPVISLFLFRIYCSEYDSHIIDRRDLENYLDVAYGEKKWAILLKKHKSHLEELFYGTKGIINLSEFESRLSE